MAMQKVSEFTSAAIGNAITNVQTWGGIITNVKAYGAKGDGTTNDTQAINNAINAALGEVFIPDGVYLIDGNYDPTSSYYGGIKLKSNISISLSDKAILKAIPSNQQGYSIIQGRDVSNVVISGGAITGDRFDHVGSLGEFGMGIDIRGSNNVTIKNMTIKDCWGDGIYIGSTSSQPFCQNIQISNIIADNNRRQGVSVISTKGLRIDNCRFINTNGIAPQSGLDLEPNTVNEFMEDVIIKNVYTENNAGSGIVIAMQNMKDSSNTIDITIESHNDIGSYFGIQCSNSCNLKGIIRVNNCTYKRNKTQGLYSRDWGSTGPRIEFNRIYVEDPNVNASTSDSFGSGILVYRTSTDTTLGNTSIGNIGFFEPIVRDLRTTKLMRVCMYFQDQVSGGKVENCSLIDPIELSGINKTGLNAYFERVYWYNAGLFTDRYRVYETSLNAAFTLNNAWLNGVFNNNGNTSNRIITLGTPVGDIPDITFEILNASWNFRIQPAATEAITPIAAAGKYIESNVLGSRIKLRRKGTVWIVVELIGTWTIQP